MVPGAGIEPARSYLRGILSPLRLPIPPSGRMTFGLAKYAAPTGARIYSFPLLSASLLEEQR